MIRLLLGFGCISLMLAGTEVSAFEAAPAEPIDDLTQLYIEVASAYAPLSECMRPLLDGDFASIQALNEKAIAMADVESLDRVASSVLGTEHPALVVARLLDFSHWARVTITQLTLGVFALLDSDRSMLARTYRYKAVGIVMISLAQATDGRCSPSNALFYWMDQVPHADH